MIPIIAEAINISINVTQLFEDGLIKVAFGPYIAILGSVFFGVFFGFIGAGLYINEKSTGTLLGYLILVGIFCSIILHEFVVIAFGLILVFLIASVFYKAYMVER